MDSLEPKKLALIRILQILESYSNSEHPMTQVEIAERLNKEYGIVLERKAVARNLSLLKEAGYEIESGSGGSYLDQREFDDAELRLLIDSVIANQQITKRQAGDLVKKISQLSNKYFADSVKNLNYMDDTHTRGRSDLFYDIEVITDAIRDGRRVSFEYEARFLPEIKGYMSPDNRLEQVEISPVQITMRGHEYYVIGILHREERSAGEKEPDTDGNGSPEAGRDHAEPEELPVKAYRVDLIRNLCTLDTRSSDMRDTEAFKYGFSYSKAREIIDSVVEVSMICSYFDMDSALEYFGEDIKYRPIPGIPKLNPLSEDYSGPIHDINSAVFQSFTADFPILLTVRASESAIWAFAAGRGNVIMADPGWRRKAIKRFTVLADLNKGYEG